MHSSDGTAVTLLEAFLSGAVGGLLVGLAALLIVIDILDRWHFHLRG